MSQAGEYERSVSSRVEPEAGWIRVESDYALPRRFEATIDSTEYPAIVTVRVEVGDDTRSRCRGITVTPRDSSHIETATLRALPLKTLLRQAAASVMEKVEIGPDGAAHRAPMTGSDVADFAAIYGRRRGGTRISKRQLARVATIHRAARRSKSPADRRAPTQMVARRLNVSRSTAGRWVMAARKAGILD